jgi:hypothetical protein
MPPPPLLLPPPPVLGGSVSFAKKALVNAVGLILDSGPLGNKDLVEWLAVAMSESRWRLLRGDKGGDNG